jgi:cold shock CspA family protein
MSEIIYGVVVDCNPRGFFFLLPDNSRKQIFGHARDVVDRLTLKAGDRVSFQMEPSPKGPRAIHVRLLAEGSVTEVRP